jgi:hypothetical protein
MMVILRRRGTFGPMETMATATTSKSRNRFRRRVTNAAVEDAGVGWRSRRLATMPGHRGSVATLWLGTRGRGHTRPASRHDALCLWNKADAAETRHNLELDKVIVAHGDSA